MPTSRSAPPPRGAHSRILGAIDVGTNAVRLELARPLPDGSFDFVHTERDPVRPGEGVFTTGRIPREVEQRLLSTLRRYAALARRHRALVRAVATSAVREAKNGPDVVARVRAATGLELEVISGKEEARLIALGVLRGQPPRARNLVVDIGGGSTEIAVAVGDHPTSLFSVAIGSVRLTETFDSMGKVPPKRLELMRTFASEAFQRSLPRFAHPRRALGSSGTIGTIVSFAAEGGRKVATRKRIRRAVEVLAGMGLDERRRIFDARRGGDRGGRRRGPGSPHGPARPGERDRRRDRAAAGAARRHAGAAGARRARRQHRRGGPRAGAALRLRRDPRRPGDAGGALTLFDDLAAPARAAGLGAARSWRRRRCSTTWGAPSATPSTTSTPST